MNFESKNSIQHSTKDGPYMKFLNQCIPHILQLYICIVRSDVGKTKGRGSCLFSSAAIMVYIYIKTFARILFIQLQQIPTAFLSPFSPDKEKLMPTSRFSARNTQTWSFNSMKKREGSTIYIYTFVALSLNGLLYGWTVTQYSKESRLEGEEGKSSFNDKE